MTTWIKTKGKLIFDPDHKTSKHRKQGSWKKTAMIFINDDVSVYYGWFLKKRFNLDVSAPLRGTHLTIINDRFDYEVTYLVAKKNYNGKIIEFEFNPDMRTDGNHWWMNARCKDAEVIRIAAGLSPTPYFGFHITVGRPHDRQLEHSHYIHSLIKKYKGINM